MEEKAGDDDFSPAMEDPGMMMESEMTMD